MSTHQCLASKLVGYICRNRTDKSPAFNADICIITRISYRRLEIMDAEIKGVPQASKAENHSRTCRLHQGLQKTLKIIIGNLSEYYI